MAAACAPRRGRSVALLVAVQLRAAAALRTPFDDISAAPPRETLRRLLASLHHFSGARFSEVVKLVRDWALVNEVDVPTCAGLLAGSFASRLSAMANTARVAAATTVEAAAAAAAEATVAAAATADGGPATDRVLAARPLTDLHQNPLF